MYTAILLVALVAGVSAQCVDEDANCPNWASNGFCTNTFYPPSVVAQCKKSCNLCPTCTDSHTLCPTLVRNHFCESSYYSTAEKKQTCAKSCGLC